LVKNHVKSRQKKKKFGQKLRKILTKKKLDEKKRETERKTENFNPLYIIGDLLRPIKQCTVLVNVFPLPLENKSIYPCVKVFLAQVGQDTLTMFCLCHFHF
jgi:retron-type reverse transcriptase